MSTTSLPSRIDEFQFIEETDSNVLYETDAGDAGLVAEAGDGWNVWFVDESGIDYRFDFTTDRTEAVEILTKRLESNTLTSLRQLARNSIDGGSMTLTEGDVTREFYPAVKGKRSEILARHYDTLNDLKNASDAELLALDGIGQGTVDGIRDQLTDDDHEPGSPAVSSGAIEATIPDSGITFDQPVSDLPGIGKKGTREANEVGIETVGDWWDAGCPFQFAGKQFHDDLAHAILGSPQLDETRSAMIMRVFTGAVNGAVYDRNGERLGGLASSLLGLLNWDDAAWAWIKADWHEKQIKRRGEKKFVDTAHRHDAATVEHREERLRQVGAFLATGDDVPRDVLTFEPHPAGLEGGFSDIGSDERTYVHEDQASGYHGVETTFLSGLHSVSETEAGNSRQIIYRTNEIPEDGRNEARFKADPIEFIGTLFGTDFTNPDVAQELVEIIVDVDSYSGDSLAVLHHPAGHAHAIVETDAIVTPEDFNLDGEVYDPVDEWAEQVAQQHHDRVDALAREPDAPEFLHGRASVVSPEDEFANVGRIGEDTLMHYADTDDGLTAEQEAEAAGVDPDVLFGIYDPVAEIESNIDAAEEAGVLDEPEQMDNSEPEPELEPEVYDPTSEFDPNEDGPSPLGIGAGRLKTLDAIDAKDRLDDVQSFKSIGEMQNAVREMSLAHRDGRMYYSPPDNVVERLKSAYDNLPEDAQREFLNDHVLHRRINAARKAFNRYLGKKKREQQMPSPIEAGPSNYPAQKARKTARYAREGYEELTERVDKIRAGANGAKQRALNAVGSSVAEQNEQQAQSKAERVKDRLEPGDIVFLFNTSYGLAPWGVKRLNKKSVRLKRPHQSAGMEKTFSDGTYPEYDLTTVDYDSRWLTLTDRDEWEEMDPEEIVGDDPHSHKLGELDELTGGYEAAIRYLMGDEWVDDNLDLDDPESAESDTTDEPDREIPDEITDITGLGDSTANKLGEQGIETPQDLAEAWADKAFWSGSIEPILSTVPDRYSDNIGGMAAQMAHDLGLERAPSSEPSENVNPSYACTGCDNEVIDAPMHPGDSCLYCGEDMEMTNPGTGEPEESTPTIFAAERNRWPLLSPYDHDRTKIDDLPGIGKTTRDKFEDLREDSQYVDAVHALAVSEAEILRDMGDALPSEGALETLIDALGQVAEKKGTEIGAAHLLREGYEGDEDAPDEPGETAEVYDPVEAVEAADEPDSAPVDSTGGDDPENAEHRPDPDDLPDTLEDIPGIGPATISKLEREGIETPADLGVAFEDSPSWHALVKKALGRLPAEHFQTVTMAAGELAAADGTANDQELAERVHSSRSHRSQVMDEALQAKRQTTSFEEWITAPNAMDFVGVDDNPEAVSDSLRPIDPSTTKAMATDGGIYDPIREFEQ